MKYLSIKIGYNKKIQISVSKMSSSQAQKVSDDPSTK